ncbi:MAG: hypothetical protein COC01_08920 [Bacteroidetes bacterium]|nr:MAG: hypothetical protein COC01_08920 [Bacteroidota bacterium]
MSLGQIKENTDPELKAKMVNGLYKVGIFVLKGNKKTDYLVTEFTFKWKRKNYKYEFLVKHKSQWISAQAMDYFGQATKGDLIIIKDIIAKDPKGNKIKMKSIKRVIK